MKRAINDALKSTGKPVAYLLSSTKTPPYIVFFMVSNVPIKLSNKRHAKKQRYQINLVSERPLDVNQNNDLMKIQSELEKRSLSVTEWQESMAVDEDERTASYLYWCEVSGNV